MISNKTIQLLKTLNEKELKKLSQFISFSDDGAEFIHFFNLLCSYYPLFDSDELTKEFFYKKIYPKKKYEDVTMRHHISKLNKIILEFFIYLNTAKNNKLSSHILLDELKNRNLPIHFESLKDEILQNKHILQATEIDSFLFEYLNQETYRYYLYNQQKRAVEPNLQTLSDSLDLHYIINKLKIYCEVINYQNISKTEYDVKFIETILPYLKQSDISQNLLVRFYLQILDLLRFTEQGNERYIQVKYLLFENYKQLSKDELSDIYSLIKNFCIRYINKGDAFFSKEMFDLYKFEIDRFKESKEKEFSVLTFKNIVTLGLRLKDYKWVLAFINDFSGFIPTELQKNAHNFNMAQYYFASKEYKNINKHLNKIDTSDVFLTLSAKALQARSYYEQKEIVSLESLLQSFKMFLLFKKKLGYHRTNYLNFIKFVTRLNRFRYKDFEPKHIQKLKEEIENEKNILEKSWLLEKVREYHLPTLD